MPAPAPPDPPPSAVRPSAFLLLGLPEDNRADLQFSGWNQQPGLVFRGMSSLVTDLRDLPWQAQRVYFDPRNPTLNATLPRLACINLMADADLYRGALQQAAAFVDKLEVPCFNHPAAVAASTRDGVARLLDGIPGLDVPTTVRVRAQHLAGLLEAMERAGIFYPVIARMAGDHGGVSTVRIDDASSWHALNALPWGAGDVYLTQYVDYRDPDGMYRKVRLVVIGSRLLARHLIASREWMIHSDSRDPGYAEQEREFLEDFARSGTRLAPIFGEVAERLRLDHFGIDASIRPDGSLLLFEANPCMNIMFNHAPSPNLWDAPIRELNASARIHLADPSKWRTGPLGG